MSRTVEQIRSALKGVLGEKGFTFGDSHDDPDVFGNAVVTFDSPRWCIRVEKDRGQFSLSFRDQRVRSNWHDFDYLTAVADAIHGWDSVRDVPVEFVTKVARQTLPRQGHTFSDPEEVRRYLLEELPKVQGVLFEGFPSGINEGYLEEVLKIMEEQESESTILEIFGPKG